MRILIVGASGVLGRATLPHLRGHELIGTTRSPAKRDLIASSGARAELCDVYEPGALERLARRCSPEVVVSFLTDLAAGPGSANARIRREGAPVVTEAARASAARRLVVESIAFDTSPESAAAIALLEANALESGLEALVVRFGRFWGPGTWSEVAPAPPAIHVTDAGRRAADLILHGAPGIHTVVDTGGTEAKTI